MMQYRRVLLIAILGGAMVLAGCGGGGGGSATAPPPGPSTQEATVGPFVIETTASANVNIQNIANRGTATFAALSTSGSIDRLVTVEEMDRLIFERPINGLEQIHLADFFGRNPTKLTNRADEAMLAEWSPDGRRIVYATYRGNRDIFVMNADGTNEKNLTNSPNDIEMDPTWSPDGRMIGFISNTSGDYDIYKMFDDGTGKRPLTNSSAREYDLSWSPTRPELLFSKGQAIFRMDAEGRGETQVTSTSENDLDPTWHPDGETIAYTRSGNGAYWDIFTDSRTGGSEALFAGSTYIDDYPDYSSDGDWMVFASSRGTQNVFTSEIYAKQTHAPYRVLQITNVPGDNDPDLGSPVPTVTRTLIGPAGSDHGYDPVHAHAIAAVAVFDSEGYLNLVRLGVPTDQGANLQVAPLENTGQDLVGVVWSSPKMYYVEQDEGIGEEPTVWDLSGATSRSVVLYLDAETGDLVSVLDLDDDTSTVSTAAAAGAINHEIGGAVTTVRGDIARVFGPDGETIAEGDIGAVEINPNQGVVRAF